MTSPSTAHAALVDALVAANHILYAQGVVDAFGHVSVRDDRDPARFLMARNMAPKSVTAADIMTFAHDGTPVDDDRKPYLERFIHGSIFRARPDVGAVVHSHAPATIPFGVVRGLRLRPLWHMSSFLGESVPLFEIRDAVGADNDMLVRDAACGDALASTLGASTAVLMRGHGCTVIGVDVRQAVFRGVYTAHNAQMQAEAMKLGEITFLSALEAKNSTATNAAQIARAWDMWCAEVADRPA